MPLWTPFCDQPTFNSFNTIAYVMDMRWETFFVLLFMWKQLDLHKMASALRSVKTVMCIAFCVDEQNVYLQISSKSNEYLRVDQKNEHWAFFVDFSCGITW